MKEEIANVVQQWLVGAVKGEMKETPILRQRQWTCEDRASDSSLHSLMMDYACT
jgi:hypothetical protein